MGDFDNAKQAFEEYNQTVIEYKNLSEEKINNLENQVENISKMFNHHQIASVSISDANNKDSEKFFNIKNNKFSYSNHTEMYNDYCKAFSSYLRYSSDKHGEGLNEIEKKSLGIGAASEGGYYLPVNMFENIIEYIQEISPLRKIASVIQISNDRLKLPNENINLAAEWINSVTTSSTSTTAKPTEKEISLFEHFTSPKVSQIHLDDCQFPIEKWLVSKIASSFAASESHAFINGNGIAQPKGFLTYETEAKGDSNSRGADKLECIPCVCSNNTHQITAKVLIDTVFALNSSYRNGACWLMNRKTLETVRKIKDENQTPMWNFENNNTPTIIGYPVYEIENMPDMCCSDEKCKTCCQSGNCCTTGTTCADGCTCNYPIAFGNFMAGYQIIDQGIKILRDPYSSKPWVMFYTTKRVGGDVVNTNAIKLIKCCVKAS